MLKAIRELGAAAQAADQPAATGEDANPASRITRAIWAEAWDPDEAARHGDEGERRFDLEDGLSITDLQRDTQNFQGDLDLISSINEAVPAIIIGDGDAVPVSLFFEDSAASLNAPSIDSRRFLHSELLRRDGRFRGLERISVRQAEGSFLRRAADFLAIPRLIEKPRNSLTLRTNRICPGMRFAADFSQLTTGGP